MCEPFGLHLLMEVTAVDLMSPSVAYTVNPLLIGYQDGQLTEELRISIESDQPLVRYLSKLRGGKATQTINGICRKRMVQKLFN